MSKEQLLVGLKRFLKGFLAGGVAQMALVLSTGFNLKTLTDVNALLTALVIGFLTGGLLGVQKLLSWKDEPQAPASPQ